MSLYQRVRAKLEKMASTFEPKIADDSLERIEVFKAQACCAFAIIGRECPWIPNAGKFFVIHKHQFFGSYFAMRSGSGLP